MIRSIYGGNWLRVDQTPSSIYIGNQQSAGMIRYNNQLNKTEVYDGSNWLDFGSSVNVTLNHEAEVIMGWAQKKMQEEKGFEELCQKHPSLQEAYEKLQIIKALVTKEQA